MHGRGGWCVATCGRLSLVRLCGSLQRAFAITCNNHNVCQGRQGSDAEHEAKMCWMYGQLQAEHGLEFATPAEAATWLEQQSLPSPPEPEMADAGIREAGEWVYRALAQGVIRSGPSLDSERTGKLAEGETITVSERQDVPGTMRVRFEKGWASVTSKKGTPLLEEGAVRLRTAKGWVSHQAP